MKIHDFIHAIKIGMSDSQYLLIYCRKCGFVSYDQSTDATQRNRPECIDSKEITSNTD